MKLNKHAENIATIILAVVCMVLIVRLMVRVRAVGATAAVPAARTMPSRSLTPRGRRRLAAVLPEGPFLNVDLYQQLQAQPMPAPDRDPFAFPPTPEQVQAASKARQSVQAAGSAPATPVLPPLPFTAVGYSQTSGGQLEAYLSGEQRVYAVREGDQFDKRYLVVKITPLMIEIRDETLGRTAELPFPQ